jgi:hypothetical protein
MFSGEFTNPIQFMSSVPPATRPRPPSRTRIRGIRRFSVRAANISGVATPRHRIQSRFSWCSRAEVSWVTDAAKRALQLCDCRRPVDDTSPRSGRPPPYNTISIRPDWKSIDPPIAARGVLRLSWPVGVDFVTVHYVRDDATRRITLTLIDPLTVTELITAAEHQLADGAWLYGLLVDARDTFVALRPIHMRLFAASLREFLTAHGPRGPIAIVARESAALRANMYLVFGEKTESFEVFWDLDDAQEWLDERMTDP